MIKTRSGWDETTLPDFENIHRQLNFYDLQPNGKSSCVI